MDFSGPNYPFVPSEQDAPAYTSPTPRPNLPFPQEWGPFPMALLEGPVTLWPKGMRLFQGPPPGAAKGEGPSLKGGFCPDPIPPPPAMSKWSAPTPPQSDLAQSAPGLIGGGRNCGPTVVGTAGCDRGSRRDLEDPFGCQGRATNSPLRSEQREL